MPFPRRRADHNALSNYWNALVRGASDAELAPLAEAVDSQQRELIERMRGRQRIAPDPAFVARLERDLQRDIASAHIAAGPLDIAEPRSVNVIMPPNSSFRAYTDTAAPQRWIVATFSTLAIIAITLVAVFLILVPRYRSPDTVNLIAPAAESTAPAVQARPEPTPSWIWHAEPGWPVDVEFVWQADIPDSTVHNLVAQIAVDPDGNVWAIDGVTSRFLIVAPGGDTFEVWGEPGTGNGRFDFQREDGAALASIAFAPDGGFYVADSQNARVQQFAADRTFVRAWGKRGTGDGQFLEPIGVTVADNGTVYVSDDRRNDVQIFEPDGAFIRKFGGHGAKDGQLNQPGWGAFDREGHFWIADTGNGRLQQFDSNGAYRQTIDSNNVGAGVIDQPTALATDGDGRVYVADRASHRIQVFDSTGRWLIALGLKEPGNTPLLPYQDPAGVAIDGEGNIYILDIDAATASLQKFQLVLP
jgi:sugar lactone lactonase YvrE